MSVEAQEERKKVVEPRFPALRGRCIAVLVSAIIGPPIAGFVLGCMGILSVLISEPAQFQTATLALPFWLALLAPMIGSPIALVSGSVGILFGLRVKVIKLNWVLLITLVGLTIGIWVLQLGGNALRGGTSEANALLFFVAKFSVPALVSAALCWRWLRSFHSPDLLR